MNVGNELRAVKEKLNELWKLVISMRASGGAGTHGLLSNTHNDTTTAAAQRGDIVYSDANNSWKRLAKGTSGQVLQGDGTDTKWGAIPVHASRHQSGGADSIKLDDLAAPDDNTDLDVSINKHGLTPKAPNDTGKFLRGDGTWQKLTSGGANIQKLWTPDLFPTGYAAQCDHFDDASLDAKWTAFQAHAALTVTESGSHLKMVDTGNGAATHNLRGYYQALPAGDFTIIGKFAHIPDMSSEQGTFLALFQDATNNPNTCDIYTLGAYSAGAAPYVLVSHWGQWDTFGSNPYVGNLYVSWPSFFRIRHAVVGGTHTWFFDISYDAHSWYRVYRAPEVWTPDAFGILVDNRTAANVLNSWFDWIYYVNSDVVTPPGSTADFWIT